MIIILSDMEKGKVNKATYIFEGWIKEGVLQLRKETFEVLLEENILKTQSTEWSNSRWEYPIW